MGAFLTIAAAGLLTVLRPWVALVALIALGCLAVGLRRQRAHIRELKDWASRKDQGARRRP